MQERNAAATIQTRATYKPGVLQAKLTPHRGNPVHHGRCYPFCARSLPSAALKTLMHTSPKCWTDCSARHRVRVTQQPQTV